MTSYSTDRLTRAQKKHIGNDIVNIIWSEHKRDFNRQTFTTSFNFAHIIIYPLPNGLFRIQIYRKEGKVRRFSSIVDACCCYFVVIICVRW